MKSLEWQHTDSLVPFAVNCRATWSPEVSDVLSHLIYIRKVWETIKGLIAKSHPNLSRSMFTNMTFLTRTWMNHVLNYAVMLLMDRLKLGWILARCRGVTKHEIVCWLFWGRSEITLTLETSPGGWRVSPRSLRGYSGPVPGSPAMEGREGGDI